MKFFHKASTLLILMVASCVSTQTGPILYESSDVIMTLYTLSGSSTLEGHRQALSDGQSSADFCLVSVSSSDIQQINRHLNNSRPSMETLSVAISGQAILHYRDGTQVVIAGDAVILEDGRSLMISLEEALTLDSTLRRIAGQNGCSYYAQSASHS